jgi:MFS family permease
MASTARPRAATTAIFLANGTGIGVWATSIAPIKLALNLSDGELGFALLAFAVGAILTMTVTGHISAHLGSVRVTLIASFAFSLALLLPAAMPNLWTLALAILVFGACNGAMDVSMNGHGSIVEAAGGKPIMSSLHAAFSLGCLLGSRIGGFVLGHGHGPLTSQTVVCVFAAVLTLVAAFNLAVPGPEKPREPPVGFVLPTRAIMQIGALAFLCMFAEGAIGDWAAVYLVSVAGVSTALATWGFSGFAFAMTIGRIFGDRLVHKLGRAQVVMVGALLAVVGLGITLLFPGITSAVIGYALAGLGIANIIPVMFGGAGRRMPDHPAIGVAMAATCGYAGFLISPPLIGFTANEVGLRLALVVLVVAIGIVALAAHRALGRELDTSPPRAVQ